MQFRTLLICISLVACSNKHAKDDSSPANNSTLNTLMHREHFPSGEILKHIACAADTAISYSLYLPENYDSTKLYPFLFFCDPHGKGFLPLELYHVYADTFQFALAGSNNSKNGVDVSVCLNAINTSLSDLQKRLGYNTLFLSGFSGGAKTVMTYSSQLKNPVPVIYSGASAQLSNGSATFPLLGFAGLNDMNYSDLVAFDESLENHFPVHQLIEWDGKHEWPAPEIFEDAFYFCALRQLPIDSALAEKFILKKKAAAVDATGDYQRAEFFSQLITFLSGKWNTALFEEKEKEYSATNACRYEKSSRTLALEQEQEKKSVYMQNFNSQNLDWWKTEINKLNNNQVMPGKAGNQRLLGFISLAGYSLSKQMIAQKNFTGAQKMLDIYKLADPKNPDQPFITACLHAQQGMKDAAISDLNRAIQLGFSDCDELNSEPLLAPLRGQSQFEQIINTCNKNREH